MSSKAARRDEDWEPYGSLLEEFFAREEVAFELAQLLDPRPDQVPDLATLAAMTAVPARSLLLPQRHQRIHLRRPPSREVDGHQTDQGQQ